MRKRANHEGTIYYSESKQRFIAQLRYKDAVSGASLRKTFYGLTPKEVSAKMESFKKTLSKNRSASSQKHYVTPFLKNYLEYYIKPSVKIKSFEKATYCLTTLLAPILQDIKFKDLDEDFLQNVFNKLSVIGGAKQQGLSPSTVRATRRYLSGALNRAVALGYLDKNPVLLTKPPKAITKEIHPLDEEQVNKLLSVVRAKQYLNDEFMDWLQSDKGHQYILEMNAVLIYLELNTGMRIGEIFGLQWDCIHFDQNLIEVKRNLVATGQGMLLQESTKTVAGLRKILVPVNVMNCLKRWHVYQSKYASFLAEMFERNDMVFTNTFGKYISYTNYRKRYFKKLIKAVGIPDSFTFHDLRHTHATLLLKNNVPIKVISERLGHSTVVITMDTYSHVLPSMQEESVEALARIIK